MADGKIQIRGGKLLAANGKLTRVDSCCCTDLGPPECDCSHSLPVGPLTIDLSGVTIVPPGGCAGIACSPSVGIPIDLYKDNCEYTTLAGLCVGGYEVLVVLIGFNGTNWVATAIFECTSGGATSSAIWTGGTDPCDPTGTYTATTNCTGSVTVGLP